MRMASHTHSSKYLASTDQKNQLVGSLLSFRRYGEQSKLTTLTNLMPNVPMTVASSLATMSQKIIFFRENKKYTRTTVL